MTWNNETQKSLCYCLCCINLLMKQIFFFKTENCKVTGVQNNVRIITNVPNNQVRPGQKLRFACRLRGHFLQGNKEVECLANGEWSDPFPTCGGKSILPPCSLCRENEWKYYSWHKLIDYFTVHWDFSYCKCLIVFKVS